MTEPDPGAAHRAHFADNRANWDDRAALHEACGYGIAELLASPAALTADVTADLERLGDLTGLDVIHLQCHLGLDTISLARLGARRVVGLVPSLTEALALSCPERVVGATRFCVLPPDLDERAGRPVVRVGGPKDPDLGAILALAPELVVANKEENRREDVEALRRGVVDGTIDVIGTDHAPHPIEEKDCEWAVAANGMIGLETVLSVVQGSLVDAGLIDWEDVARLMSYEPARICASPGQGRPVAAGEPANLCFVDPDARRKISGRAGRSKSHNTPWEGRTLPGRVMYTVHRGVPTVWEGGLRSHEDVMADRAKLDRVGRLTV